MLMTLLVEAMPKIEIRNGKASGQVVELSGSMTTLGNRRSATVEIRDSWVSFNHAQITRQGDRFFVADMGSKSGTTVNGRKIAIFKTASGFYAIDAECPHKGGPLAFGWVENDCVYCPLHGWEFSLKTGFCRAERKTVETYPVRVEGEELQVALRGG